ncbi:Ribosomal protein L1 [Cinnamomum micranthum f. kanehirae]|uniref:Ribosomal protein n=1 Tax=Cinnamomum micranthum f. kanehirae TaxID=337451 RepID=A0A3S3N6I6_9MAGN|nr:Ribosomal protein L1 [Cinnamomum micranthum f. kanehirae]
MKTLLPLRLRRAPPPPRRQRETGGTVPQQPEAAAEQTAGVEPRTWTREDIRYVKDVPSISPVSYPTRVAPLLEDKVSVSAPKEEEEGKEEQQLEREWRRIEADARLRRVFRTSEEEEIPFPTLVKTEKKKQKVVLDLQEAIREVKANAKRRFVETIEAHVKLGVDPRRGDQMVRGATTLPHGTGKVVRVAVFAEGIAAVEARAAGSDIVGGDELIEEIKNGGGKFNFDKCTSTPTFMPRLGKIARILGRRGMMPNPKLGSVTNNVAGAVKEGKCGRIDFKIDKTAIVHIGLGKV